MNTYIGIDVSKKNLDIDYFGRPLTVENNGTKISHLIKKLKRIKIESGTIIVVVEASGGYEKKFINACHRAGVNAHVAHANKIRAFAKAKGLLAKTDQLDAMLITQYAQAMQVKPDKKLLSDTKQRIKVLLDRRNQLLKTLGAEENRLELTDDPIISRSIKGHIRWIKKEIGKIKAQLDEMQNNEEIKEDQALLTSIPSIGRLSAHYLISYLPELGHISNRAIAALAGVAPYNRDSGNFKGKRYVQGGRDQLRQILYMAAISAIRFNPELKLFYDRLRGTGKPAKVAIIAVLRKLLTIANSVMHRRTPWQTTAPQMG